MDAVTISLIGIAAFVVLMALGTPIAFCFILVGVLGLILLRGMFAGLSMLESAP
jgi:hypothetical protein